jgi:hypothetical protein
MAKYVLGLDAVKKRFFPLMSQIGINYRDSSLSRHGGGGEEFHVRAGDRMPYFLLDGVSVYDLLREPRFHLLTFSDGQSDSRAARGEVERRHAPLVDHHVVPLYPRVAEIYGTDRTFDVLLRPDNHIGFISRDNAAGALGDYLSETIGRPHA